MEETQRGQGGQSRVERLRDSILSGPIIKTLFALGWPVMLANAFEILYNLVDTYWLGKIGKEAVAAPTVGFPILFLLISVAGGFSIAGVSLVSQHTGAGTSKQADEAAGQVIAFMLIAATLVSLLGELIARPLLAGPIGAPPAVLPKAVAYIRVIFAGLPFMFTFFAFRALMRGVGDMITPMMVTGGSIVINMVLDPILIFGWLNIPALGVSGAAIATVFSRALASAVAFYLFFSGRLGIELKLSYFIPKMRWVKQIVRIGGPASIGQAGTALGAVILVSLISRLGVVVVSAYGIGQRLIRFVNLMVWGLASPLTTMIGQNIGAQQTKRAETIAKRSILTAFAIMTALGGLVFLLRRPLFRIFIDDPAVVEQGSRFLAIFIFSIPFFGLFALASAVFRGSGHTRPPMVMALIRLLGLRVGVSYLLAFPLGLGADGLWIGLAISNLLGGFLAVGWLARGSWKERTIEEEKERGEEEEEVEDLKDVGPV